MSIEIIKESLPDYAKDVRANLSVVVTPGGAPGLTQRQIWGTALASAVAARHPPLQQAICHEAGDYLDATAIAAAKSAAAIMAMTNVYYRFTHVMEDKEYSRMPARLRMSVMANPGIPAQDFELWCLAVSAVNGCAACMESHEHHLRESGTTTEAIQSAVRIAAVIHSVAVALEAG